MKKLLILLCLVLGLQWAKAAPEIQFEQAALQEVLSKAKSGDKLVFLDAYTSWCGPCKWMAANAFKDSTVAAFFNAHFLNVSLDMEQGEGPEVAKKYGVAAYPTLLFLDGAGEMVHIAVGARSAVDLLQLGKDVVEGKVVSIPQMKAKFEAGERDPKFLHDYILELAKIGMDVAEPLEAYKPSMKGEAMLAADNWEIFRDIFRRNDTEFGQYFLMHLADFEAKFGKKEVEQKAVMLYNYAFTQICIAKEKDAAAYQKLRKEVAASGIDAVDRVLKEMDLQWLAVNQSWKKYAASMQKLIQENILDQHYLNRSAWIFYEAVTQKSLLKKALGWAEKSVAMEKSSANVDTQAMLLMKLGRKTEAIAAAKESILLGKAGGEDVSETEAALAEMLK